MKTHTFVYVFAGRPHQFDGKRIPWHTKTEAFENGAFRIRRTKTYRFLIASLDGRKRFENASVDADMSIRFRWIKNGGIRKRISVDVASYSGYTLHID